MNNHMVMVRRQNSLFVAIGSIGIATVFFLAGCSTGIKVQRVTDGSPQTGNPWNLSMTTFKITITRQVTDCDGGIKGKVDFMATPEVVLDLDQRYVLKSNGWWATSDIVSELSSAGISTGLNAQSTDKTASILTNAAGTIANFAIAGAAGSSDPATGAESPRATLCSKTIVDAVKSLYSKKAGNIPLKIQVEQQTTALATASAALALSAQQAKFDKQLRRKVVDALQIQETARIKLEVLELAYSDALKLTSDRLCCTNPPVHRSGVGLG